MGYELVVFDGDETLVDGDVLVALGERAGVVEELATYHERTWRGEMDPIEALRQLVTLLEGLPVEAVEDVVHSRALAPGAREVGQAVACETAVFTSIERQGQRLAAEIDADYVCANRLLAEDGVLTGEIRGDIVDGDKGTALRRLASEVGVAPEDVVVGGDGPQDVPMFEFAGFAVAVDPKPEVRAAADVTVDERDFRLVEPHLREKGVLANGRDFDAGS